MDTMCKQEVAVKVQQTEQSDTRWLAMTIRRGLLVIIRAIELRYGLDSKES